MIESSLRFILECEKLKSIERRTSPAGLARMENSAEHSWSLALMAMTLIPAVDPSLDTLRVLKMVIVHDLVEIDAGDTFCYGDQGEKQERERLAAARIFGLLPDDLAGEVTALWEEFEQGATRESAFANAMDRLLPLLQNHANGGGSWVAHGITLEQVMERNRGIGAVSPELGAVVKRLAESAVANGWLTTGKTSASELGQIIR